MIDILLPVYQVNKKYFNELLKSLSTQSFTNFRVLFGYDDTNSEDIIRKLLVNYPKIICVHIYNSNDNPGIFSNLNNLSRYIEGDYVQFLCQDDVLYNEFLNDNYKALKFNNCVGLSFCQVDWCDQNSIIFKKDAHKSPLDKSGVIVKKNLNLIFLNDGCIPGNLSPVMLTKKAFFENLPFNENLKFASDFDFWYRISRKYNFYYVKKSNIILRKHTQQASETIGIRQLILDRIYIYNNLLSNISSTSKKFKAIIYLNQTVGANQMLYLIRNKDFSFVINKFRHPFYPLLSTFFLFITLNGRIKYFNNKNI
jgi:glycosyltransferase involved in cell wall biosynthesis